MCKLYDSENNLFGIGYCENDLYQLSCTANTSKEMSLAVTDNFKVWHRRLGHIVYVTLIYEM